MSYFYAYLGLTRVRTVLCLPSTPNKKEGLMRELLPAVYTWPWFSQPHGYNFNGWFVRHPGGNLCIDPVVPPAEALAELTRHGVSRVLLTNRNHVRAANQIRTQTGARTTIHPEDAPYARGQQAELDD
jgi:hypothetical protein